LEGTGIENRLSRGLLRLCGG